MQFIPQELAEGRLVQLGEFGSFGLRLRSSGVETPAELSPRQVDKVLVRFHPGKPFRQALARIEFEK